MPELITNRVGSSTFQQQEAACFEQERKGYITALIECLHLIHEAVRKLSEHFDIEAEKFAELTRKNGANISKAHAMKGILAICFGTINAGFTFATSFVNRKGPNAKRLEAGASIASVASQASGYFIDGKITEAQTTGKLLDQDFERMRQRFQSQNQELSEHVNSIRELLRKLSEVYASR